MGNYRDSEMHKSIMATIKKDGLLDKPKPKASAFEKTPVKTQPVDKIANALRDAKRRRKKFMAFTPLSQ